MAVVHNVQVYPIHAGHVNDHKVMTEHEFPTAEEAIRYINWYNNPTPYGTIAVYTGAIDTETGENL